MARLLGARFAQGHIDQLGNNPYLPLTGWNVTFDVTDLGSNLTQIEVYHIALDGPVNSSAEVIIDGRTWDYVNQGWQNGWDPSEVLVLQQVNLIVFAWNVPFTSPPYNRTTNIRPRVTLWLRLPQQSQQEMILPGLGFPVMEG